MRISSFEIVFIIAIHSIRIFYQNYPSGEISLDRNIEGKYVSLINGLEIKRICIIDNG